MYPTPINFSYAYSFGSLVGIVFALQMITGIFLAMHYTPHVELAFASVVHIMTDVKNGYLVRYLHANGASMIFILLYIHIGRGLYFRSYIYNRRYLWWSGIIIFLLMIITAFIGYVLPWGQMSFWGATVITSLVTAIPFVGENIAHWIWGGYSVNNATLIRFYSLHYLLPFIITSIVLGHLVLLHNVTSTNPAQVNTFDKMPFHPYFTFKDIFALTAVLLFFITLVHFYPNILGHSDNFIPANPLVTPPHIVPEWYFTPFYAILRSCPNKLGGVIFMLAAILILFLIPFFKIPVNAIVGPLSFLHKVFFWSFCAVFFILMFLGGKPATAPYVVASQVFTFLYFLYFLFFVPLVPLVERLLIDEYHEELKEYEKEINAAYKKDPNNKNIWKEVKFKTKYEPRKEVEMMKKKNPNHWFYL
jgi:quinol-cytochrome oxidoreductase complex cytochrome b subunit